MAKKKKKAARAAKTTPAAESAPDEAFESLHLLEDEPVPDFHTDELGLIPTAKVIAGAAIGTRGPFTIGVFGDWGHGKTSVLRQAKSLLDSRASELVTVWFNAWQYEREDHPIVPLAATIVQAVETKLKEAEGLGEEAKGWLRTIGRGIRAIAYGFSASAKVGVPGFGEVEAGFVAKEMIDRYEKLRAPDDPLIARTLYYNAFETLRQAAGSAPAGGEADGPKIVVFIDDLDRCLPPQGIKLLESIKLVLSQPGFVFALAVDRRILEAYLAKRYEQEFGLGEYTAGGTQYLDKIVQLPLGLPPHKGRFDDYIKGLLERPVFQEEGNAPVREAVRELVDVLAIGSNYNPRNLVRFVNNLIVDRAIWMSTEREADVGVDLLGLCAVTRMLRQHLGERLYRVLIENQELCDDIATSQDEELAKKWGFHDKEQAQGVRYRDARLILQRLEAAGFLTELLKTAMGKKWLTDHDERNRVNEFLAERPEPEEARPRLTAEGRRDHRSLIQEAVRNARSEASVMYLHLEDSDIVDLEPLRGLTSLQSLYLTSTQVTDLEPLRGLESLQRLDLINTPVANLEPIRRLIGLESLYLMNTRVSDIKPLRGLARLETLDLDGTQVADLEPLKGLSSLWMLSLNNTPVAELEPLQGLESLIRLDLMGTPVADLEPLKELANLKALLVGGTPVTDLGPLRGLSSLGTLYLQDTRVTDFEPLQGLGNLRYLVLSGAQVTDLEPLRGLESLEWLDLRNTPVTDLEPLKGLTNLEKLDLDGTPVADLEPLRGLGSLEWLDLRGTPVSDEQVAALREALPKCTIVR